MLWRIFGNKASIGFLLRILHTILRESRKYLKFTLDDFVGRVTAVPIPNTEVKPTESR